MAAEHDFLFRQRRGVVALLGRGQAWLTLTANVGASQSPRPTSRMTVSNDSDRSLSLC